MSDVRVPEDTVLAASADASIPSVDDSRPFGVFLAEPIHIPPPTAEPTWPSACKIKGIWAPDDF